MRPGGELVAALVAELMARAPRLIVLEATGGLERDLVAALAVGGGAEAPEIGPVEDQPDAWLGGAGSEGLRSGGAAFSASMSEPY